MGEQHQDVGIRTVGIHARPPESESEGVGQQAVLTTASVAYSGARPSLQGSWLRGTGRGQVSNSGALPGAGADGGPGAGFLLQSTCSPAPRTPHPPCYPSTPSPGPLAPGFALPQCRKGRDADTAAKCSGRREQPRRRPGARPARAGRLAPTGSRPSGPAGLLPGRPLLQPQRPPSSSRRRYHGVRRLPAAARPGCGQVAGPQPPRHWPASRRVRRRTGAAASARASSRPMKAARQPT